MSFWAWKKISRDTKLILNSEDLETRCRGGTDLADIRFALHTIFIRENKRKTNK